MSHFDTVHRFRTLAARGAVHPLVCTMCQHDLTIRLGKDDEPMLRCYTCGHAYVLGEQMFMRMEHAIESYERNR